MSPLDGNTPMNLVNLVDLAECNAAAVSEQASLPEVAPLAAALEATTIEKDEESSVAYAVAPAPALTQTLDANPEAGGSSSSGGNRTAAGSEHSSTAAATIRRTSACKPHLAANKEEELLAEIDHLQQRLKDSFVERDLQVAIAQDEVLEKQKTIIELLVKQEDAERFLREAHAEEKRLVGECEEAKASTATAEKAAAVAAAEAADATARAIQQRAALAEAAAKAAAAAEAEAAAAEAAAASQRGTAVALPRHGLLQQGIEAPLLHVQDLEPATGSRQQYHALGDNSPIWRLLDHRAWLQRCLGGATEQTGG